MNHVASDYNALVLFEVELLSKRKTSSSEKDSCSLCMLRGPVTHPRDQSDQVETSLKTFAS